MKLRPITSAVLLSVSLIAANAAQAQKERRSYIIQLADKPVATYEGTVTGLTATGGNLKVGAPAKVVTGGTGTVAIAWSGLPVGKRHMGVVTYLNGASVIGNTVLEVDTTDPLPLFQNARHTPVLAE